MTPITERLVSAPWTLTGNGYILLYKFPKSFVKENGFLLPESNLEFTGGFGTIMLVDYHASDVGPYRELLFVPGMFQYGDKKHYSITKIYVSSTSSVINGQENWGIPKEFAHFTIEETGHNQEHIQIKRDGKTFFDMTIRSNSMKFPINTHWLPVPHKLVQPWNDKTYITQPDGKGKTSFATIENLTIDSQFFPDISQIKPLAVIRATNFELTFPIPTIFTSEKQNEYST